MGQSYQRTVIGRYTIYRIVPLLMTLSDIRPDFKVTTFFDIEYLRNDRR